MRITAEECPRIAKEFLEEERRALGERWFRPEYLSDFSETVDAVFDGLRGGSRFDPTYDRVVVEALTEVPQVNAEVRARFPPQLWASEARELLAAPERWQKWALHDRAPSSRTAY